MLLVPAGCLRVGLIVLGALALKAKAALSLLFTALLVVYSHENFA